MAGSDGINVSCTFGSVRTMCRNLVKKAGIGKSRVKLLRRKSVTDLVGPSKKIFARPKIKKGIGHHGLNPPNMQVPF